VKKSEKNLSLGYLFLNELSMRKMPFLMIIRVVNLIIRFNKKVRWPV